MEVRGGGREGGRGLDPEFWHDICCCIALVQQSVATRYEYSVLGHPLLSGYLGRPPMYWYSVPYVTASQAKK